MLEIDTKFHPVLLQKEAFSWTLILGILLSNGQTRTFLPVDRSMASMSTLGTVAMYLRQFRSIIPTILPVKKISLSKISLSIPYTQKGGGRGMVGGVNSNTFIETEIGKVCLPFLYPIKVSHHTHLTKHCLTSNFAENQRLYCDVYNILSNTYIDIQLLYMLFYFIRKSLKMKGFVIFMYKLYT